MEDFFSFQISNLWFIIIYSCEHFFKHAVRTLFTTSITHKLFTSLLVMQQTFLQKYKCDLPIVFARTIIYYVIFHARKIRTLIPILLVLENNIILSKESMFLFLLIIYKRSSVFMNFSGQRYTLSVRIKMTIYL